MSMSTRQILRLICNCLIIDSLNDAEKQQVSSQLSNLDKDWPIFFKLSAAHWLLPNIYYQLKQSNLLNAVPSDVQAELKAVYDLIIARNNKIKSQTQSVIQILNESNITPLLLKGASYLLNPISPIQASRMTSDIDILIGKENLNDTIQALKKNGYNFMNFLPDGTQYHLDPMNKKSEPARLELHLHPLAHSAITILSAEVAWKNATHIITNENYISYSILHAEDRIIHQLAHAQIHSRDHANNRIDLRQLFDFYLMAQNLSDKLDWEKIKNRFHKNNYSVILSNYISLAQALFPTLNYLPFSHNVEQRLLTQTQIARIAGDINHERLFYFLTRTSRIPKRLTSYQWYKSKLKI